MKHQTPIPKTGSFIVYNDGRVGHKNVKAVVLEADSRGMTVSFEDRADVTRISYNDPKWMDRIVFSNPDWPIKWKLTELSGCFIVSGGGFEVEFAGNGYTDDKANAQAFLKAVQ